VSSASFRARSSSQLRAFIDALKETDGPLVKCGTRQIATGFGLLSFAEFR